MTTGYFLILIFAFISCIQGRGLIPVASHAAASLWYGLTAAIAATSLGYSIAYTVAVGLVVSLGMLIWMVGLLPGWGGWGLYFASWTWRWDPNETEVPSIDKIGMKLVPFVTPDEHWTNGLRGTICMAVRGLYVLPLCFALQLMPVGILLGLSMGLVYGSMRWLAPKDAGTEYAEPVFGALIGAAISYRLVTGF